MATRHEIAKKMNLTGVITDYNLLFSVITALRDYAMEHKSSNLIPSYAREVVVVTEPIKMTNPFTGEEGYLMVGVQYTIDQKVGMPIIMVTKEDIDNYLNYCNSRKDIYCVSIPSDVLYNSVSIIYKGSSNRDSSFINMNRYGNIMEIIFYIMCYDQEFLTNTIIETGLYSSSINKIQKFVDVIQGSSILECFQEYNKFTFAQNGFEIIIVNPQFDNYGNIQRVQFVYNISDGQGRAAKSDQFFMKNKI